MYLVNYRQGSIGENVVRVHKILTPQPSGCRFEKMNNTQTKTYQSFEEAICFCLIL
jgi:hypothetical protein